MSGTKTATLSDKVLDGSLLLLSSSTRISEIIVAAVSFRGLKEKMFDSVMVGCKESKDSDHMQLWFAKVLALVRVDHQRQCVSFFLKHKAKKFLDM